MNKAVSRYMNVRLSHHRLCEVLPRNQSPRDKGIGKNLFKMQNHQCTKGSNTTLYADGQRTRQKNSRQRSDKAKR